MTLETLIPMTTYVLQQWDIAKNDKDYSSDDYGNKIIEYAKLLKEPLCLSMFVPAVFEDGKWVVLEKPDQYLGALEFAVGEDYENALKYQEAKANCYFEGFEYDSSINSVKNIDAQCLIHCSIMEQITVENLLDVSNGPTLSETLKNRLL